MNRLLQIGLALCVGFSVSAGEPPLSTPARIKAERDKREKASMRSDTKTTEGVSQVFTFIGDKTRGGSTYPGKSYDDRRMAKGKDALARAKAKQTDLKAVAKSINRRNNKIKKMAGRLGKQTAPKINTGNINSKIANNQRVIGKLRRKINRMKVSMGRAGKAQSGVFWTQMLMAAWDASATERRAAIKEGRQVSKMNQTVDFFKRVSGYAAFKGLHGDVQFAVMSSMLNRLEENAKLGFDITDREVFDKAYQYAYNQGIKAGIVGGAKLLPVIGETIAVKETFDSAGELYNELDATAWSTADNEQQQFQTWMRAALKAESAADLSLASAAKVKSAVTTMQPIAPAMNKYSTLARSMAHRQGEAIAVIHEYLAQQKDLESDAASAMVHSTALSTLENQIQQVTKSATEQLANIERIKSEYKAGKLNAKGVATNKKFIGDLFDPSRKTVVHVREALSRLETLAKGAQLAGQIPEAIQTLQDTTGQLQRLRAESGETLSRYLAAADTLALSVERYTEARERIAATMTFVDRMIKALPSSINPKAADRIRSARTRAAGALDLSQAKKLLAQRRGLTMDAQAVAALSELNRIPTLNEGGEAARISAAAKTTLEKLSEPDRNMRTLVARVESGLSELGTLAGMEKPEDPNKVVAAPAPEISQKKMMSVTLKKLNAMIAGKSRRKNVKTWAGFTVNQETSAEVAARVRKSASDYITSTATLNICSPYYRIVKQGTVRMWWDVNENNKRDPDEPLVSQPYWIYYTATIRTPNGSWGYVREDGNENNTWRSYQRFLKPAFSNTSTIVENGLRPVRMNGVDLGAAGLLVMSYQQQGAVNQISYCKAFAGVGPFDIEVDSDLILQVGHYQLSATMYDGYASIRKMVDFGLKNWPGFPEAIKEFEFYATGRVKVATQTAEWLSALVEPYVTFSRKRFHFAAEQFVPPMKGFTSKTNIKKYDYLSRSTGRRFRRTWIAYTNSSGSPTKGHEGYVIYINCQLAKYDTSWNDALEECRKRVSALTMSNKNDTSFDPGLGEGVVAKGIRSIGSSTKGRKGTSAEGTTLYNRSERVRFFLKNVTVTVEGGGVRMTQPELRTSAIAKEIAARIAGPNRLVPAK